MKVNEIFYSIQGESLHAGRPCIFIRLTGCNLRCSYCDTTYAYEEGQERSVDDLCHDIAVHGCRLVEITGGEPLLQNDTIHLVQKLLTDGYEVLMETNGSMDISKVDTDCVRIVDMKCPSSGEHEKNDYDNLRCITPTDQVKLVICDRKDYEFAKSILVKIPDNFPRDHVLFSPVSGSLSPEMLSAWILEDKLPVRLHLQLHKIIWPTAERGV